MNTVTKKQICLLSLALALPVVFFFAVHKPLCGKCEGIKDETETVKAVIADSQILKANLPKVKNEISKLEMQAADFEMKIPQDRDLGYFLQQITEYMNNYNLSEQYVSPGNEFIVEDLHCIPVVMRCKGRLDEIFSFYKSLRDMGRLIKIDSLVLDNDKGFTGNIRMETNALIYYRKEQGKR